MLSPVMRFGEMVNGWANFAVQLEKLAKEFTNTVYNQKTLGKGNEGVNGKN